MQSECRQFDIFGGSYCEFMHYCPSKGAPSFLLIKCHIIDHYITNSEVCLKLPSSDRVSSKQPKPARFKNLATRNYELLQKTLCCVGRAREPVGLKILKIQLTVTKHEKEEGRRRKNTNRLERRQNAARAANDFPPSPTATTRRQAVAANKQASLSTH